MNKRDSILNEMNNLFPNPKCELNYSKDYELLLAVMLSAQTTDKRVNLVTEPQELILSYSIGLKVLANSFSNLEKISVLLSSLLDLFNTNLS